MSMRHRRSWRLALLLPLAAACGDGGFGPAERNELARAEARWEEREPAAYRFDYQERCFCPEIWARITVRHGTIVSVEPAGEAGQWPGFPWPTVDSLFVRIHRRAAELEDWDVDVEYDRELGYPVRITVDPPEGIVDGGAIYDVTNFVVLE